ncbi:hypothetical protein JXA88_07000 [Candidatus Fermentibacteria bacterium]|nr:hypothetical protein [Candidatus Fermentibacteria bacterium]
MDREERAPSGRGWAIRCCILLLFLGLNAQAAPGIQRVIALGPPVPREVALPDSFVVGESVVVWAADSLLSAGAGFRLDFRNRIHFLPSMAESTVRIQYRFLPLGIPVHLQRRALPSPGEEIVAVTAAAPATEYPADLSSEHSLQVAGTKTIGVRFGSGKDPSLDQALQVQLQGRLAGDVEVTASLSDQSTPIQPQGTTQELRDIDRVVIELKRKESSLSVGDCAIATEGFRFLSLERKMQGVAGTLAHGQWSGDVAAASTGGTFVSVEFTGIDGAQGPYYLARHLSGGASTVVILAGTERVWVDGSPVARGSDKDYTIDYSTGEVTFTERRPITGLSRISVDFQYTAESYRRTVYLATAVRSISDAITIRFAAFREADDASQPMDWILGEEERAVLGAAGDDPERARAPTYRFVGLNAGTYDTLHVGFLVPHDGGGWDAVFDSVGASGSYRRVGSRFEYYGPGGGPFAARAESTGAGAYDRREDVILVRGGEIPRAPHTPVDMGRISSLGGGAGAFEATFYRDAGGDYVRVDAAFWAYVGPGHGDYVAWRTVQAPRSHESAVVGIRVGEDSMRLDVEAAAGVRDANTLSSRDDRDNTQGAVYAHLSAHGGGGVFPWWQGGATWRSQGAGFATPGRARPVEWTRDWSGIDDTGSEDEATLDLSFGLPRDGRLGLVLGGMRRGTTVSRRAQVTGTILGPGGYSMTGRFNRSVAKDDTRWWTDGALDRPFGFWSPLVMWKGEANSGLSGRGYMDIGAGARIGRSATTARVVTGSRITKEHITDPDAWMRSSSGRWWEIGVAGNAGVKATARVDFNHTRLRYATAYRMLLADQGKVLPEDIVSSLGTARVSALPVSWGPRLELDYKISGRQSEQLVEELVPEESWETNVGEYDSLGTWVGTELGTHKKVLVPSGGAERTDLVEGIVGLRLAPGGRGPEWRRRINADVTGRIQVTSRSDRRTDLYLLRPAVVKCDSTTLRRVSRIDGSMQVRPAGGEFAIATQFAYAADADNRRVDQRTRRHQTRCAVRARGARWKMISTDMAVYRASSEERESPALSGGSTVVARSKTWGFSPAVSLPLTGRLDVVGSGELSREDVVREVAGESREATEAVLHAAVVTPGLRLALPGRGRFRIDGELAWRRADGPWSALAPLLRRVDQEGFSRLIKVGGEHKIQEKLTLTMSLSVGSEAGRGKVREGSMELVAYF